MSLASINRLELLRDRAFQLKAARAFFDERRVLEVDVPILSEQGSVDLHIDLIQATIGSKRYFLHSSPEYGMKRLLAENMGDIYQISHVFRLGEQGALHNPEFTMVEWYRMGFSFDEMIQETLAFIRLFLTECREDYEEIGYRDACLDYGGAFPSSLEERDALFAFEVEPHLGKERLTVVRDFPKEQAALARINAQGHAERFEIYYKGIELANGYHELTDTYEQRQRFENTNKAREALGKEKYPLDEALLSALEKGVADCCGVAAGFDRLMMLRHALDSIQPIMPFSWENA